MMNKKSFNNLIENIIAEFVNNSAILNEYDSEDPHDITWYNKNTNINNQDNKMEDKRKINKDKIIKSKQKSIDKAQERLNSWLNNMAENPNINIVQVEFTRRKEQKRINNKIYELIRIKKLPLSDEMFN